MERGEGLGEVVTEGPWAREGGRRRRRGRGDPAAVIVSDDVERWLEIRYLKRGRNGRIWRPGEGKIYLRIKKNPSPTSL